MNELTSQFEEIIAIAFLGTNTWNQTFYSLKEDVNGFFLGRLKKKVYKKIYEETSMIKVMLRVISIFMLVDKIGNILMKIWEGYI